MTKWSPSVSFVHLKWLSRQSWISLPYYILTLWNRVLWQCPNSHLSVAYNLLQVTRKYSSRFSRNSEVFASEFLENLEDMYYMQCNLFIRLKSSMIQLRAVVRHQTINGLYSTMAKSFGFKSRGQPFDSF